LRIHETLFEITSIWRIELASPFPTPWGELKRQTIVSESGLYALIFGSTKPEG
jgi:prophage antirepressor-like protein